MVTITRLKSFANFSSEDVDELKNCSSAAIRYLNLLQRKPKSIAEEIRQKRHEAWLEASLATQFETSTTREIVEYWSDTADDLIRLAWQHAGMDQHKIALFAFGKLGARELNLSSDVDLLFVSRHPADAQLLSALRKFSQLLSENSDWGFALRVDTDLRPGGRFGPLVSSVSQFEDYYSTQGATWERLAYVRLRPVAGDDSIKDEIFEFCQRFSYRKFLDYTLFDDLKELRHLIQSHKQVDEQIHLKLDRGGIRDIELFIHALQVIHGGKNPELRLRSTEDAGRALIKESLFDESAMKTLISSYWFFRDLEHKAQLIEDQQTHIWVKDELKEEIRQKQSECATIVNELLGKEDIIRPRPPTDLKEQLKWLENLGFNKNSREQVWPSLQKLTALSSSKQRDEQARQEFLFHAASELAESSIDMDHGLSLLGDFVRSTRAKATFFSLLNKENSLRQSIIRLFGTSAYLGQILASRPELVDNFLYRAQDTTGDDTDTFLDKLTERRLLTDLLASSQFLEHQDILTFSHELSVAADGICDDLLTHINTQFKSSSLQIVKLGKWGGEEMGLKSDLDFFFFTDKPPTEDDHKVARRFISWLTEQHRGGNIYQIDLRLRPSGNAGPVIVSQSRLNEFLQKDIPLWQRQSYLRARSTNPHIKKLLKPIVKKPVGPKDIEELTQIRRQLTNAHSSLDIKNGRGGLIDIEFAVQTQFLIRQILPVSGKTTDMFEQLATEDSQWRDSGPAMQQIYLELRRYEQLYQLLSGHSGSALNPDSEAFKRLAKYLKTTAPQLNERLSKLTTESQITLKALDPVFSAI